MKIKISLIGLLFFVGIFNLTVFAQQETVILTSGTSWTVPGDADVSSITIECWGAGGGGSFSSSSDGAGGGGGGGAYAKKSFTSLSIGQDIDYEIGVGGTGGIGTNPGGDTWFFANSTGGVKAAGGKGGVDNSKTGANGGSASISIGDVKFDGGKGGNGSFDSGAVCGDEQASGGGGAAAITSANGTAGENADTKTGTFLCDGNYADAGAGGSNLLFTGYTSKGGDGNEDSGDGHNGTNGAGGGGAVSSTYNGGNGGDGLIRITYDKNCPVTATDTIEACGNYTWIDGIEYTQDESSATHTIPEGAANGCDSIVTLNLTILSIDISTSKVGINLSSNSDGSDYQWIDCDNNFSPISGATEQTFTPVENGNYAVIVSENSCSDTSECIIINSVGVDKQKDNKEVKLFPNPTTDKLTVTLNEQPNGQSTLELLDATGRLLSKQVIQNKSTNLNLANYGRGVYIIRITNGKDQQVHRVIKE